MIQEIAVAAVLAAVVIYVGCRIYGSLKGSGESPCDDCEGCALKDELKGAKFDCKNRKKERNSP